MKLKELKPTKEKAWEAVKMSLTFLIMSPIIALVFLGFPSVREATNPLYGECNVSYHGVFMPCLSNSEALWINLKIVWAIIGVMFIVLLFVPEHWRSGKPTKEKAK